jgi:hypothetical protein
MKIGPGEQLLLDTSEKHTIAITKTTQKFYGLESIIHCGGDIFGKRNYHGIRNSSPEIRNDYHYTEGRSQQIVYNLTDP